MFMHYMEIKSVIESQRIFFNSNATKDIRFRIEQLKKLKAVLKQNEAILYEAIYADFKKSEFETYTTELLLLYNDIDEAVKNTHAWSKVKRVKTNLFNFPAKSFIIPEPLGLSLIIGAWNYPYQLSLAPAIAAIVAGNTVVLKPSEVPVNTSRAMFKMINENFAPEFFSVVEGGELETTALLAQKFDKIFFTGSTTVGKIVYQAAAKHLTPVTLELGGKSPVFITKNCDIETSAKRVVWAKFLNAGQTCIAPDYILVDAAIKEKFLETLKAQILKFEYSFDHQNYVQIINQKSFDRLMGMMDKEKIYCGGKNDRAQRYIEPTILSNISFSDKVMEAEIFGPILPVIAYDRIENVIAEVKKRPKPLSCYVYTNDASIKNKILKEISFGGGAVNDSVMHISNSSLPFGGVGDSGTGSYHGEAGFKTFSHYKSVLEKSPCLEPDLKYSPYSKARLSWIKNINSLEKFLSLFK
jgi:aldehyde dehydrogenase (NAD+)